MKYVLTIQCAFSKFVWAIPVASKEPEVIANALLNNFVTQYGCPAEIRSDGGGEFENRLMKALCDRLQIRKTKTPAESPQSNMVERFHRTLGAILRSRLERDDPGWKALLPMACFAYNTRVHSSTGCSPHEAFLGRPARMPIDLVLQSPTPSYATPDAYIVDVMDRFNRLFKYMREHQESSFSRSAKLYTGRENTYSEGDLVWLFSNVRVPDKSAKFTSAWVGPYSVIRKHSSVLVDIKPTLMSGKLKTVHQTRLSKYHGPRDARRPVYPRDEDDERGILDGGDEMAELITFTGVSAEDLTTPVNFIPDQPETEIRDLPRMGHSSRPLPPTPPRARGRPKAGPSGVKGGAKQEQVAPVLTDPVQRGAIRKQPKRKPTDELTREDPKSSKTRGEKRQPSSTLSDEDLNLTKRIVRDRGSSDISSVEMGAVSDSVTVGGATGTNISAASLTKPLKVIKPQKDRSRSPVRDKYSGQGLYLLDSSTDDEMQGDKKVRPPRKKIVPLTDQSSSDISKIAATDCSTSDAISDSKTAPSLECSLTSAAPTICKIASGPTPVGDKATCGQSRRTWCLKSVQTITVRARSQALVDTGLKLSVRPGRALLMYGCEQNERKRLHISPLMIDHSYNKPIKLLVTSSCSEDLVVNRGQVIAKCVSLPLDEATFVMEQISE